MLLLGLTLLAGCDQIDQAKDLVDGVTDPTVTQAILIGIAEPDSEDIDLSGTDFDKGAALTVFVADATSVDDLENAPVEGADVSIRIGDTPAVSASDEGSGLYKATGEDGMEYSQGDEAVLTIGLSDTDGKATQVLPPPANPDLPEEGDPGQGVAVNIAGQDFEGVIGVVLDLGSGEVTWSNEPEGIQELYDFTNSDAATSFEIPGVAFQNESVYAIGVAGLNFAESENFDDMNTALSSFMVGQLKFFPYSTLSIDD